MKQLAFGLAAALGLALAGCQTATVSKAPADQFGDGVLARWTLALPYESMNTGWLEIKKLPDGKYTSTLLWRWASPNPQNDMVCDGKTFTIRVRHDWPNKEKPADQRYHLISGRLDGGNQEFKVPVVDGNGRKIEDFGVVKAVALTPPGPKPDLSKARKGQPVDLLAGGLSGWTPMGTATNCWSVKDGILSNRVPKDKDGKVIGHGANLKTVRADFFDFNLKGEVRLPKGSNSGIYLRGIYEIQMIDSFGKPLDCHNMGALYGRVTPSVAAEKPAGEWQTIDITLYKRHVTVVLNGKTIIDNAPVAGITGGALQPDESIPGPLYLQGDHSDADYRNLILTPLQ